MTGGAVPIGAARPPQAPPAGGPGGPERKAAQAAGRVPCLVLLSSQLGDQVFPLRAEGITTIGRKPDRDVVLADPRVSAAHAEIERVGASWVLRDLGSTNGTRLNGVTIQTARLEKNDRLELGGTVTVYFSEQLLTASAAAGAGAGQPRRAALVDGHTPRPSGTRTEPVEVTPMMRADAVEPALGGPLGAGAPVLTEPFVAALAALGDDIGPLDDEDEILARVLAFAAVNLDADRACVLPPRGAAEPAWTLAQDGELLAGTPSSLVDEVIEEARRSGAPAASTRAMPTARRAAAEPPSPSGRFPAPPTARLARGAAAAPLTAAGQLLGLVYLDRDEPGSYFEARDLLALGAIAASGAQALMRARRLAAQRAESATRTAALEKLADDRARLLAMAAHDLKTPLSGLLGYLDGLLVPKARQAADPEWLAAELEVVATAARGMLSLLTDLLDGQVAEAGAVPMRPEPLDLATLLADFGALYQRWAEGAGRHVAVEAHGALPLVDADPRRLGQIVNNLVHNAIRHTPRGGRIVIEARPLGGTRAGFVEVAVVDEGRGLEPSETDRMLAAFACGAAVGPSGDGHGLGLAIASRLVRRMGGELRVQGGKGVGARFAFTLPVAASGDSEKRDPGSDPV